jgi:hypothetical protein
MLKTAVMRLQTQEITESEKSQWVTQRRKNEGISHVCAIYVCTFHHMDENNCSLLLCIFHMFCHTYTWQLCQWPVDDGDASPTFLMQFECYGRPRCMLISLCVVANPRW